jgi:hypothetical protein
VSNGCATAEAGARIFLVRTLVTALVQVAALVIGTQAQAQQNEPPSDRHRAATVGLFLAGGALGLGAHEAGHVFFDVIFDADPGLRRVDFHGIPFFAITHRSDLPPAQEFTIASAGFWVQHAGNEWLLTRRPRLRYEDAPLAKGVLAFNVLASGAYAGAAFFRTGPLERDTKGMADSADIDERAIGLVVLAPAVLDTWRYFRPESRLAVWMSRAAKIGGVLLVVKALRTPDS